MINFPTIPSNNRLVPGKSGSRRVVASEAIDAREQKVVERRGRQERRSRKGNAKVMDRRSSDRRRPKIDLSV
jgi:hypothetical protein